MAIGNNTNINKVIKGKRTMYRLKIRKTVKCENSSPASRTKRKGHPLGCPFLFFGHSILFYQIAQKECGNASYFDSLVD